METHARCQFFLLLLLMKKVDRRKECKSCCVFYNGEKMKKYLFVRFFFQTGNGNTKCMSNKRQKSSKCMICLIEYLCKKEIMMIFFTNSYILSDLPDFVIGCSAPIMISTRMCPSS